MRRTILKSVVAGSALAVYAGTVGGLKAFAQTGMRIRRSLHDMKLDDPDLATYRDFVKWMLAQDQSKAVSWLGFASQHGTLNGGYKYCPHGDWYFLPWHRGFVLMYEQAAATLLKNPGFAMPYWDWTLDRKVPEAFANPVYNGAPNPLYVPSRRNDLVLGDEIVGPEVMETIYASKYFLVFGTGKNLQQQDTDPKWVTAGGGLQGLLERTPHNLVHNALRGYMPTPASPRDPIFMMHHGNIDRIWAYWNAMGNKNDAGPLWLGMKFENNYLRPDGTPYSMMVSDLVSTTPFGYTYPNLPAQNPLIANAAPNQNLLDLWNGKRNPAIKRAKVGSKASLQADRLFSATAKTAEHTTQALLGANPVAKGAYAILSNVQLGEKTLGLRVFVNLENTALSQVPATDPHFVGMVSFLSHRSSRAHAGHKALPSTAVDLTPVIRKLAAANLLKGDHISVQLLPVALPGALEEEATLNVEGVEIVLM